MAKTLKEEELRLNIIVNGDPARKEIGELTRKTIDLANANDKMRAEQRKLREEGLQNSTRYKELTANIKANSESIKENKAQVNKLQSELKLETLTISELVSRHAQLRAVQRNTIPGTAAWKKLSNEISAINLRMAQLRAETTQTEGVMCRMASNVNKYIGTATAAFAAFAMYGSGLYKAVQSYSALDESMSNARKTTNMTRREVEELSGILANIDTRTAQNELLSLARIGGKLGIAKAEIEGFTRAADIIKIALGKDLGDDVETTIGQVGKLVNVFHINKEFGIEQGMMKTAASLNELGKASTANEANIVEFMRRVGGVGYSAKISIANIAGLGATLDNLGQTMEVAGTSMSQVITGMFRRTDAFAAAAKMSVADFKKLMAEDMNEALIRMAEGMGSDGAAMGKIVAALDSLKLDGTRATGVLTALAQNTEQLREQQEIANKAFNAGTSCLEEFNIMNNSVEATTEKRKKQITAEATALGKSLIPAYHESLSAQASLIKTARILIEWLIQNRGVILGLVASYTVYKGVIVAVNTAKKIHTATVAALRSIKHTYMLAVRATTIATLAETGATKTATTATRLFSIALKSSPLGWVAAAIGGVVGAFTFFTTRASAASTAQKTFNDITKAAADIEDEHGVNLVGKAEKLTQLMRVIEDETASEGRRTAAIKDLQELMPNGIELINQETIANGEAAKSVKAYTNQLILQATIKAALQKKQDLIDQAGRDRMTGDDKKVGWLKRGWLTYTASQSQGVIDYNTLVGEAEEQNKKKYQDNVDKQLADIDIIITDTQEKLDAMQLVLPAPVVVGKTTTAAADGGSDTTGAKTTGIDNESKSKKTWSLDNDANFLSEKKKLRQQYADGEIVTEQSYQDKLRTLEITALKARLAANKESGADREKLGLQLADKLLDQKKQELQQADAAEDLRIQNTTDATLRENAEYERKKKQHQGNAAALEQIDIEHNRNLAKIRLDKINDAIKVDEDSHNFQLQIIKSQQASELLAFTGSANEKKKLRKKHQEDLAEIEVQYATELKGKLEQLLDDGNFGGLSLDSSLLSEAEKSKLEKKLLEIKEILISLGIEMENLHGGGLNAVRGTTDLLGFSLDDWGTLFKNLEDGKAGVQEVAMVLKAMTNTYATYDKFATAAENRQLKQFKKNNDTKKRDLNQRLELGLINQDEYNARSEQLDAEYDAKQEEIQINQARRQKALSIADAIINTAVGVTAALKLGPIIGPILAAMIGAMGAVQIALVASQPIPGAEEGSFLATRAQDGKKFQATIDPDKRGYIEKPTVITGENGMEYVIPNEAMQNPTARPIIDTFESIRQKGRLRDADFGAIVPALFASPGRASGGPISASAGPAIGSNIPLVNSNDTDAKIIIDCLQYLCKKADDPVPAIFSLLGQGGFVEVWTKYQKLKKRGQLGGQ